MKRILAVCFSSVAIVAGSVYAANEITASVTLRVVDGSLDFTRTANAQHTITNAFPQTSGGTVSVPTNAATAVITTPVSVNGWAYFRNLDATNSANVIAVGVIDSGTNFLPFARFKPSEYGLLRLAPGVTIYCQSIVIAGGGTVTNTASRLEKFIADD